MVTTGLPTLPRGCSLPARVGSQSAPQRLSLRIVTLTLGDSGMFAQAAGFLSAAPLQIAFMKSVGLRPPSYFFPAMKIVGLPLGPLLLRALERREEQVLPFLAFGAGGDLVGWSAELRGARRAVRGDLLAVLVLAEDEVERLLRRVLLGADLEEIAFDLVRPVHRARLAPLGLADVLDVQVEVGAELRDDVLEGALRLHAVWALGHDVQVDVHGVRAHVLRDGAGRVGGDALRGVRVLGVEAPHQGAARHEADQEPDDRDAGVDAALGGPARGARFVVGCGVRRHWYFLRGREG